MPALRITHSRTHPSPPQTFSPHKPKSRVPLSTHNTHTHTHTHALLHHVATPPVQEIHKHRPSFGASCSSTGAGTETAKQRSQGRQGIPKHHSTLHTKVFPRPLNHNQHFRVKDKVEEGSFLSSACLDAKSGNSCRCVCISNYLNKGMS